MVDLYVIWAKLKAAIIPAGLIGVALVAVAVLAACGTSSRPADTLAAPVSATGSPSAIGSPPTNPPSPTTAPQSAPGTRASAPAESASNTEAKIAVRGTVLASPGCPGPALAESPCPGRFVAGARVELSRGGRVVATTRTDASGHFELRVSPGNYQITAFNVGFASHTTQTISAAGSVDVQLVVDSGLR